MKITKKQAEEYINYRKNKAFNHCVKYGIIENLDMCTYNYFKYLYKISDKKSILNDMKRENKTFREVFNDIKKRDIRMDKRFEELKNDNK